MNAPRRPRGRPGLQAPLSDDVALWQQTQHAVFEFECGLATALDALMAANRKVPIHGEFPAIDWELIDTMLARAKVGHARLARFVKRLETQGQTLHDALSYRLPPPVHTTAHALAADELNRALVEWHRLHQVAA